MVRCTSATTSPTSPPPWRSPTASPTRPSGPTITRTCSWAGAAWSCPGPPTARAASPTPTWRWRGGRTSWLARSRLLLVGRLLDRLQRDVDLDDPWAVDGADLEPGSLRVDRVADPRRPAELAEHVAADAVVVLVGQRGAEP